MGRQHLQRLGPRLMVLDGPSRSECLGECPVTIRRRQVGGQPASALVRDSRSGRSRVADNASTGESSSMRRVRNACKASYASLSDRSSRAAPAAANASASRNGGRWGQASSML